jgi:hypothetical protein
MLENLEAVADAVRPMKTFIRAAEVWVPDRGGAHLEFCGGLYGEVPAFGATSRSMIFGRGEGLPGQAWEEGKPIILTQLEGSSFRRIAAAKAAGITTALAIPVVVGDFVTAVLVLFFGDDAQHVGAIELWRARPPLEPELRLVDGYYGTTTEVFELVSRRTMFRRGVGLPGIAWATGDPVFLEDLGQGNRFLRADAALRVGINRGLGVPCATLHPEVSVLTFLSALGTPIARRIEIWAPDTTRTHLVRMDGFCERTGRLKAELGLQIARGEGALGRTWLTGVPAISYVAVAEMGVAGADLEAAGLSSFVCLPVIMGGRLRSIVSWYF